MSSSLCARRFIRFGCRIPILILLIIKTYLYSSNIRSACSINESGKGFIINIPLKYYYNKL